MEKQILIDMLAQYAVKEIDSCVVNVKSKLRAVLVLTPSELTTFFKNDSRMKAAYDILRENEKEYVLATMALHISKAWADWFNFEKPEK